MKRVITAAAASLCLLASAGAAHAACGYDAARDQLVTNGGAPYAGAEGQRWFIDSVPLSLWSDIYEKLSLPRQLTAMDFGGLVKATEHRGVMVFTEESGDGEVVYLPVRAADCSFQLYARKR